MGGVVSGIVGGGGGGTTIVRAPTVLATDKPAAPTVGGTVGKSQGAINSAAGSNDAAKALLINANKSKTRLSGNVGEAKLLKPTLLGE